MAHTKLDYSSTVALFKEIATKHKQINSFVEVDLQEIKDVVKSPAQLPAMLYSSFREGLSGAKADSNMSRKRCFIAVIDAPGSTKSKNPRGPHAVIDDCRDLALDVVRYLRKESREGRLVGFSSDSTSDGDAIIMRDDNFFGWELSLEINTPIDLSYKPEKWT
jgi:hypothetical protein